MHRVHVEDRDDGHIVSRQVIVTDDDGHEFHATVFPADPLPCGCDTGPRMFVDGDLGEGCCLHLLREAAAAIEEAAALTNPHAAESCPYVSAVSA